MEDIECANRLKTDRVEYVSHSSIIDLASVLQKLDESLSVQHSIV